MTRPDRIALLFSLLAVVAAYLVADRVFERMAHIEDEMAYIWQAEVIAGGRLTLPSPPYPNSTLVPFVVDTHGQRFGKYPLGWPVVLAAGVKLGQRAWVNPLLAGLGVWLTYRLGKKVLGERLGLLAAGLTLTSPFFLLNSGSLLSHPLGLALSTAFAMAWLDAFPSARQPGGSLPALVAGLSLGVLALTRPLTAVGVGLPFAAHALYLLWKGSATVRRRVLLTGSLALVVGLLLVVWQWAVTGDPSLNPYTLWWPYDKIGFGPEVGHEPGGHTLNLAWFNLRFSLQGGMKDLFGWGTISLIFVPFGVLALLRRAGDRLRLNWELLVALPFPSLLLVYMLYWIGSALYGPRYYYEGLYSLTILTAAGVGWLAGWRMRSELPEGAEESLGGAAQGKRGWLQRINLWWDSQRGRAAARFSPGWAGRLGRLRPWLVGMALFGLVGYNLAAYLPARLGEMTHLYGISRARLAPFLTPEARALTPALVIVYPEKKWTEYGALLELQNAGLTSPFMFALNRGPETNAALAAAYPHRKTYHYYPAEPYRFYTAPRP